MGAEGNAWGDVRLPLTALQPLPGKSCNTGMEAPMDPVDEFARLRAEIKRLQDRADALREGFLKPGARLRSNRFEVTIKRQKRRLFQKDRLPEGILSDPRYWDERESEIVTCKEIATFRAGDRGIVLVE
jgi:hypothetical protein